MSDLGRFVAPQQAAYVTALAEISAGQKRTHWMWFIFPQLRSLGRSQRALLYGLADLTEAKTYADHPILGSRLVEICTALLAQPNRDAVAIFGTVDAKKLQSCATLFAALPKADPVFADILAEFYSNEVCRLTTAALS